MCRTQRNTKKVYRQRHAEAKAKAYKRDKFQNKLNPLGVEPIEKLFILY